MSKIPSNFTTLPYQARTETVPTHVIKTHNFNTTSESADLNEEFDYIKKIFSRPDVIDDVGLDIQKRMAESSAKKDYVTFSKNCLELARYFCAKSDIPTAKEFINMSAINISVDRFIRNIDDSLTESQEGHKEYTKLIRREKGNILHSEGKYQGATRPFEKVFGKTEEDLKKETLLLDITEIADYKTFLGCLHKSGGFGKLLKYANYGLTIYPEDHDFSDYQRLATLRLNNGVKSNVKSNSTDNLDHLNFEITNFQNHLSKKYDQGRYRQVIDITSQILNHQSEHEGHEIKVCKFFEGRCRNRLKQFDVAYPLLEAVVSEQEFQPRVFLEAGEAAMQTKRNTAADYYYSLFIKDSGHLSDEEKREGIDKIVKFALKKGSHELQEMLVEDPHVSEENRKRFRKSVYHQYATNAHEFSEKGNKTEALQELNKIEPTAIAADEKGFLRKIGERYYDLGNYKKAVQFYDRLEVLGVTGVEFFTQKADLHLSLSKSAKDPEESKKALIYYKKAVDLVGDKEQNLELLEKTVAVADLLGVDNQPYKDKADHIKIEAQSEYISGIGTAVFLACIGFCAVEEVCRMCVEMQLKRSSETTGRTSSANAKKLSRDVENQRDK
ncbi:MAG: hypothetical protein V4694_06325 [Pseudomonadota bacterium]